MYFLRVRDSETILRTTDLEITIIVSLPVSIETQGSIAIPLQTLLEITTELPEDARINLSADENNKIKMSSEVGTYDIMGKPADEFPAVPEVDNRKSVGVSSGALNDLINKTVFAVSRDELKPALTGVLFRFGEEELTGVATDGHRLVRYARKDHKAAEFSGDVIVPKKFLNLLLNVLKEDSATELWMGDNHMTAAIDGDTYFTRIIDERFPDFDSVIPKDNDKELVVDRKSSFVGGAASFYFFKQINPSNRATDRARPNSNNDRRSRKVFKSKRRNCWKVLWRRPHNWV